jgi:hypothetical protein
MEVQKSLKSKLWVKNVTYIKRKYGKAVEMGNKLMKVEFL